MAKVWKYKNKRTNKNFYAVKVYLGTDPTTGRYVQTTRRGFKTSKEAKLVANQLKLAFANGDYPEKQPRNFSDLYNLWFEENKQHFRASTQSTVTNSYENHIKPYFGNKILDKIPSLYCQRIVDKWANQNKSFASLRSLTKQIFTFGINMEICKKNPMAKTTLPPSKNESKKANFYNAQELESFFSCLKKMNNLKSYTAFRLLAFTGMRKSEMLALTWADIDFEKKSINIDKTLSFDSINHSIIIESPKTSASIRSISIDTKTINILKEWKAEQTKDLVIKHITLTDSNQFVIPNSYNKPFNPAHFNRYLYDLYKKFPDLKRITVHGFRHTHASLLFESGATVKEVQQRLGHANFKTTLNIYVHVTKQNDSDVIKKLEDLASRLDL
jgi:integrase